MTVLLIWSNDGLFLRFLALKTYFLFTMCCSGCSPSQLPLLQNADKWATNIGFIFPRKLQAILAVCAFLLHFSVGNFKNLRMSKFKYAVKIIHFFVTLSVMCVGVLNSWLIPMIKVSGSFGTCIAPSLLFLHHLKVILHSSFPEDFVFPTVLCYKTTSFYAIKQPNNFLTNSCH